MGPDAFVFTAYLLLAAGFGLCLLICPHLIRAARGESPCRWRQTPGGATRPRLPFFAASAIFLVLQAGALLMLPCALAFRRAVEAGFGAFAAGHLLLFSLLLGVSLAFACGIGALDWEG